MSSPADTTKLEKIILACALKALDKDPPKFSRAGWDVWLYAAQGLLIGLGFNWLASKYQDTAWFRMLEPILAFLLGAFLVYMVFWAFLRGLWFFLKPFVDRTAVEARLRELGP
jgi:high-affinity Fe2+/Pb2+ permease